MVNRARFYETPTALANALASYVPSTARRILDPCTGNGALLRPLHGRKAEFFAADIRAAAIATTIAELKFGRKLVVHTGDFLRMDLRSWAGQMDCVVMNPPFSGKKQAMIALREFAPRTHVTLETGFILRGIKCLRPGGRLVAIVPPSIVCGDQMASLRRELTILGAVSLVHELPPFTFPRVESRVYILVFDLNPVRRASITLLNHSLLQPEKLVLSARSAQDGTRLDFGFHAANQVLLGLKARKNLGWGSLEHKYSVLRVTLSSPQGVEKGVHTIDADGPMWRLHRSLRPMTTKDASPLLRASDLLIKRVSRDAVETCGLARNCLNMPWTDCVFALRPKHLTDEIGAMFLIRVMLGLPFTEELFGKSAGASFLRKKDLETLPIPWEFLPKISSLLGRYRRAVTDENRSKILQLELDARIALKRLCR